MPDKPQHDPMLAKLFKEALAHHAQGSLSSALIAYKRVQKQFPDFANAWINASVLLRDMGRHEEAMDMALRAVELDPENNITIRKTLTYFLYAAVKEGNPKEIFRVSDQLIKLTLPNSDNPDVYAGAIGKIKLLLGEFEPGWRLYGSRIRLQSYPGHRWILEAAPLWDGKPFKGKTLLLHYEQGFGDTIMMLRYLKQVKSLGGTLLAFVQQALVDIAGTCGGPDCLFGDSGGRHFDIQLPLMLLPAVLNTDIGTIPSPIPYIKVPERVPNRAQIDSRMAEAARPIRCGLVWAGKPSYLGDSERSIPPELLRPLEEAKGVSWFCLQREAPDTAPFPTATPLGGLLETFADTAYVLSKLDMVVTVDTAIAHLAGAMGVPVALLVAFIPDWRWLLGRDDSPWYPSVKIYRQPEPNDWPTVIQQVAASCSTPIRAVQL